MSEWLNRDASNEILVWHWFGLYRTVYWIPAFSIAQNSNFTYLKNKKKWLRINFMYVLYHHICNEETKLYYSSGFLSKLNRINRKNSNNYLAQNNNCSLITINTTFCSTTTLIVLENCCCVAVCLTVFALSFTDSVILMSHVRKVRAVYFCCDMVGMAAMI